MPAECLLAVCLFDLIVACRFADSEDLVVVLALGLLGCSLGTSDFVADIEAVRVQLLRAVEVPHGFVMPVQLLQHLASLDVGFCILLVQLERLFKIGECLLPLGLLRACYGAVEVDIGVVAAVVGVDGWLKSDARNDMLGIFSPGG